jgi:hypothetical protein
LAAALLACTPAQSTVDREHAGNHVREDIFPLVFSDSAWSTFRIIVVFEVESHDRDRSCLWTISN